MRIGLGVALLALSCSSTTTNPSATGGSDTGGSDASGAASGSGGTSSDGNGGDAIAPSIIPSDIADLVLWLRADVGINSIGALVNGWKDQSASGNDVLSESGNEPSLVVNAINGLPALQFSGGTQ